MTRATGPMTLIDRLVVLAAVGVATASFLPLLADLWWIFELFTHFRLQDLALLAILVLWLIGRRHWTWVMGLTPFILITAESIYGAWPVSEPPGSSVTEFSIMTANVNVANSEFVELLDIVKHDSPDLLLLTEFNAAWQQGIHELMETYPYRIEVPQETPFGIALLSRIPFIGKESTDLEGTPAISARLNLAGEVVRILGVHLRPPVAANSAATRDRQLLEIGRLLSDRTEPVVIVGDFNATTYSPTFSGWLTANRLRAASRSGGLTISWPTFLPLLGILIDHCIVSDDVIINDFIRGPSFGSDHYPLTATLSLRGAQ